MKKLLSLCVILSTVLMAKGQTGAVSGDGYQVFRYPNGTISSEGVLKNGKPEGFWKSYYVTGIKKSEGKYSNFQLDSVWVFFDQALQKPPGTESLQTIATTSERVYEVMDNLTSLYDSAVRELFA